MNRRRTKLFAAVAVLAAAVGAGAAIGATKLTSPKQESQAIVNDAAKQLGIDPGKLSDALKTAIENRIDAALADGRLTKEQADALKARIQAGDAPLLFAPRLGFGHDGGLGHDGGFGRFGDLAAAASYLGMTEADLRAALAGGKSLADVAKEKGKSVDGLVQALVDGASAKLDAAVKAGRLTEAQRAEILAGLKQRVADLVNGTFAPMRERHDAGSEPAAPMM